MAYIGDKQCLRKETSAISLAVVKLLLTSVCPTRVSGPLNDARHMICLHQRGEVSKARTNLNTR